MSTTEHTLQNVDGRLCCPDCGRWVYEDDTVKIRHSKRCDIPHLQPKRDLSPVSLPEQRLSVVRRHAKRGDVHSAIDSTDELVDAVKTGHVSMSDAMNQDM